MKLMLGTGHPGCSPGATMALVNFRKVSPRKFDKYKLRPVTHEIGTPPNLTVPNERLRVVALDRRSITT